MGKNKYYLLPKQLLAPDGIYTQTWSAESAPKESSKRAEWLWGKI